MTTDLKAQVPAITVDVQTGTRDLIDRIADEWRQVCALAPIQEPFCRPEWIQSYLYAFEPDAIITLLLARCDGELVGVLPLIQQCTRFCGMPARVLRAPANVHSCRVEIARVSGRKGDQAISGFWHWLRQHSDEWDVIELPYVAEGSAASELRNIASADGFPTGQWRSWQTPYIPITGSDDTQLWLQDTSSQFRRKVRGRIRRLEERGPVDLVRIDAADERAIQSFYEVERAGWKGAEGSAIACTTSTLHFYNRVAKEASRFGYFTLYLLRLEGRPIAGHFGLTYGNKYFMPKVGYDEQYKCYGPGHIILDVILRELAARGIAECDFIGDTADWKTSWTRHVRNHYWMYIFGPSIYGRVLYAAKFSVKPAIKRMLAAGLRGSK